MSEVKILKRKAVRLYSKPLSGRGVMALQYETEFDNQGYNPDSNPIYVGYDGEEGRPLAEVLRENESYRAVLGDKNYFEKTAELRTDVDALIEWINVLNAKRGLTQRLMRALRLNRRSQNARKSA